MFATYFRKLGTPLNAKGRRTAARRRRNGNKPLLTHLESRDVPAALGWAAGVNLPIAEGGIAAPRPGPTCSSWGAPPRSYTLTATDPTWQATATADGPAPGFRAVLAGRRPLAQRLLRRLRRHAERLRHVGRHPVRSEHRHGRGRGDQPDALAAIDEHAARPARLGHRFAPA